MRPLTTPSRTADARLGGLARRPAGQDGGCVGPRRSPGKEAAMAPGLESATIPSDGHAIVTVRGDIAADTAIEL